MEDDIDVGARGGAELRKRLRRLVDLVIADPELLVVGVVFVVVVVRYIYPIIFPSLISLYSSSSSFNNNNTK